MADNYTIAEYVDLPSLGKIYGEETPSRVKLRSMRTAEEMRRLSPCDHPYENMCSIIDDCTVEGIGVPAYDMCIADYTKLLYKLRTVTYGNDYAVTTQCPVCGSWNKGNINIDLLKNTFDEDVIEKYREFQLPVTKKFIRIKFQTPRMLDQINDRIREFKKKTDDRNLDSTLLFSIEQLIETIDGRKMDSISKTDWIRNLPMADTNTIWQYSEKLEEGISVDRNLEVECDVCGHEYNTQLAITKDFFRPTLDI